MLRSTSHRITFWGCAHGTSPRAAAHPLPDSLRQNAGSAKDCPASVAPLRLVGNAAQHMAAPDPIQSCTYYRAQAWLASTAPDSERLAPCYSPISSPF